MKKLLTLVTILLSVNASAESFYKNVQGDLSVDTFETKLGTSCRIVIGDGHNGDPSVVYAFFPNGDMAITSTFNGSQGKRFVTQYNHDESTQITKGYKKGLYVPNDREINQFMSAKSMQIVVQDAGGTNHVNDVDLSDLSEAMEGLIQCGTINGML